MATITIGRLTEFNPKIDTITAYVEIVLVTLYFQANDVTEEKQVTVFLSALGPKAYALLKSLVTPAIPKVKTFARLVEVLKKHFKPRPLVIAERFKFFHRRSQRAEEAA